MALGAQPADVLANVVGRGLALALAGVAIGLPAAAALTRLLESLLFGVSARDPSTFVAVLAILLLVAAAACLVPALRAMRIDPITALRHEITMVSSAALTAAELIARAATSRQFSMRPTKPD